MTLHRRAEPFVRRRDDARTSRAAEAAVVVRLEELTVRISDGQERLGHERDVCDSRVMP